ncbi:hypothetical protein CIW83_04600 [Tissierella sp. P1]|jgi:hypothetical protein|uniref:hypothetical protein n=1 Tax=unclassified Tissierella TaxID=2638726 RepID=UPI000BA0C982|nr:hypothetical protein [Tissierella sp. P1]MDU5080198.1 hypothetical protein [Bacillota bacterium]OZV13161.1 hypothetical protein CIW83_04600 [Tissierella sp. P1]
MTYDGNQDNNENIVDNLNSNNVAIQKIIEKAVLDPEFKKNLIENPDEVLVNYDISEIGKIMIKSLGEEDFDKLTPENIEEYFAADSAIYTPDFDEDIPVEYSDENDI